MDIDCDGEQNGKGDDGRCGNSDDTQAITSFQWIVEGYNKGIKDLNAFVHPYVVFGNTGSKSGWKTFEPREYGIEPLSVMAVVCGDKLVSVIPSLFFFLRFLSNQKDGETASNEFAEMGRVEKKGKKKRKTVSTNHQTPPVDTPTSSTASGATRTATTGTSPWWARRPSRWPRPASAPA